MSRHQEKAATAGFPLHGFIYSEPTTNRFPQPIYHGRRRCSEEKFPLSGDCVNLVGL